MNIKPFWMTKKGQDCQSAMVVTNYHLTDNQTIKLPTNDSHQCNRGVFSDVFCRLTSYFLNKEVKTDFLINSF